MFKTFLDNLKVDQNGAKKISGRYNNITKILNKKFRNIDSETNYCLQIGSYGRWTGIKGISDLDMIYIMPNYAWDGYKNNPSKLLTDTRAKLLSHYDSTDINVDLCIVAVKFKKQEVEVQPAFEQADGSFKYPNSSGDGSWKITKPREEIKAIQEFNEQKNNNLRNLCKMIRAWKNQCGVAIGGLLIDTLAHNFLQSTSKYDTKSFHYYDEMIRDFFEYLKNEPEKSYYLALGSQQRVKVAASFQKKAKKAYENALLAIKSSDSQKHNAWKKIFGRPFPSSTQFTDNLATESFSYNHYDKTEEFIEDSYTINIRYPMKLDCEVSQNGFREDSLLNMLRNKLPLKSNKTLFFKANVSQIAEPFELKWKILNRGSEAIKRNCIRGQIVDDAGRYEKTEHTNFRGEHEVECYAINNEGYVIARASIDVPIAER